MKKLILFAALSSLAFAAKPKSTKAKEPKNPRVSMTLSGGLGLNFGTPISAEWQELANRGFTHKIDSTPNCADADLYCKKAYSVVITVDSSGQKSNFTNPLTLGEQQIHIFTLNYGPSQQLEAFSAQSDFPLPELATPFYKGVVEKIELKYGKGYCEVQSEKDKNLCEVKTWDFGTDGLDGSIQTSIAATSVLISYKSAASLHQILSTGSKLVESQNAIETAPPSPVRSDF